MRHRLNSQTMVEPPFGFFLRGTPLLVTDHMERRMLTEFECGADASAASGAVDAKRRKPLGGNVRDVRERVGR